MLNAGTYVSTWPVVSQAMRDGEKFIKWDDVSKYIFNRVLKLITISINCL